MKTFFVGTRGWVKAGCYEVCAYGYRFLPQCISVPSLDLASEQKSTSDGGRGKLSYNSKGTYFEKNLCLGEIIESHYSLGIHVD